jgi:HSP20 family protein
MGKAHQKVQSKQKVHAIKPKSTAAEAVPARALSPLAEMERMMEQFLTRDWLRSWRGEWPAWSRLGAPFEGRTPKVDILERDDEILVHAELPGVDKNDLDVTVTDTSVTIKAETRREEKEEKGDYYRCEIAQGAFARSVALPAEIESGNAKAKFKDGVLELTLPKKTVAKRRSIRID